ncbi:ATP-dependent RNA helicase, small-subunit processome Dhx37 [Schizosaccharomyces pombe]|uniref:Putative ATP-dependent RNA helicase PB1A10.06c n=1 Tax=Schizosaccharomyces pombe (strain 972 / ATCC 24843) TaxID=284812 RepID=YK16_SCHPO|nr:putative ATP-dependent RNA helicase Dhr1 [Schizosaccharomyces pombe]Q9HDY4.1 RecName: Full=Putative ATP-dependent RNA helicase PB1A10.06c [Schizosaccharomyces pombe 972h-]CAC21479.1 ATP-dependent RNA helicase Dhr1 (predicted) [Schizosaccharomyces pombe]|eukprot:NP_593520.1 putative ATP-dependent RNA helicase Dhr1 [Schizosaccharomyces pombe]
MGRLRKRFNEKGRQSGIQKMLNLKRARLHRSVREQESSSEVHANPEPDNQDSNAEILIDVPKEERQKRKQELKDQLLKENEGSISSKKKKRLDKYIENKLKKEEVASLIAKLAEERIDTSLLSSSKNLGKQATAKEKLKKSLLEEKLGLPLSDADSRLYKVVDVETTTTKSSTAETNAPEKYSTRSGFGFGFSTGTNESEITPNIKVLPPKKKKNASWGKMLNEDPEYDSAEEDYLSTDSEEFSEDSDNSSEENKDTNEPSTKDAEKTVPEDVVNLRSEQKLQPSFGHPEFENEDFDLETSEDDSSDDATERASRFKSWANKQILGADVGEKSHDVAPDNKIDNPDADMVRAQRMPRKLKMREEDVEPTADDIEIKGRKTTYTIINRPPEIQESRLALPIVAEEQRIMEQIFANDVVIICGATGSGKTTQLPQFLFEAGFSSPESENPGMIAITQPRRVAAVSIAKRVSEELTGFSSKVSYQIRFDSTINPDTAIKFMTDGILLRELSSDFLLTAYSAVIVDEAHERSVNTDILLGLLSRIVRLRREMSKSDQKVKPLKLIIMSATLRVTDFSENKLLFSVPPPIIKIDARQYPVSIHFNRTTKPDYLQDAFDKVCLIHKRLPAGSILVFLTGQQEVEQLCQMLRKRFVRSFRPLKSRARIVVSRKTMSVENEDLQSETEDIDQVPTSSSSSVTYDDESEPMYVLPLYSLLTTEDQMKVFDSSPEGHRMCIVATNVAETSITIPNIRYVVDCGKAKERVYNEKTSVQKFEVRWISKANADQRAGRAGRTGPGHCYRLYSSAVFDSSFPLHSLPEILRTPVESIVLQMKNMNIDNIANFPFPTSPGRSRLEKSLKLLSNLGAIDSEGVLTKLGEQMSLFPLSPRFSKMLIIGQQHGCLPYVIALVSALSINQLFVSKQSLLYDAHDKNSRSEETDLIDDDEIKQKEEYKNRMRGYFNAISRFQAIDPDAPALSLLSAVCAYDYASDKRKFCKENYLREKALEEVTNLRKQIIGLLKRYMVRVEKEFFKLQLKPPTSVQIKALRQFIASAYIDQVALYDKEKRGYVTLFPSGSEVVQFVPDRTYNIDSEYVVYLSLHESRSGRVYMSPLTEISPEHLARLAKNTTLLSYSKPLSYPPIRYLDNATKRECWVIPILSANIGTGSPSWNLPAVQIIQKRINGRWVNC